MNAFDIPSPYHKLDEARAVILPVPYEATVCYGGGTGNGPEAIIKASTQVELYDESLKRETYRAGIATGKALPVDGLSSPEVLELISTSVREHTSAGRLTVCLGGEHTITSAATAPHLQDSERAGEPLTILSLDAHADLRHSYQGTINSHACVMRRMLERGANVVLAGVRSLCAEEADIITSHPVTVFRAEELLRRSVTPKDILNACTERVYLSVDLDVFDPGIMPSVGTPEPGGLDWYSCLELLETVMTRRTIVGMDLVELAPIPALTAPDFLAARLLYRLLGLVLFEG